MEAMDSQAAGTEALLWDTSAEVSACKLGVTSDPLLHLEMPLQAALQGCWSCVCKAYPSPRTVTLTFVVIF